MIGTFREWPISGSTSSIGRAQDGLALHHLLGSVMGPGRSPRKVVDTGCLGPNCILQLLWSRPVFVAYYDEFAARDGHRALVPHAELRLDDELVGHAGLNRGSAPSCRGRRRSYRRPHPRPTPPRIRWLRVRPRPRASPIFVRRPGRPGRPCRRSTPPSRPSGARTASEGVFPPRAVLLPCALSTGLTPSSS